MFYSREVKSWGSIRIPLEVLDEKVSKEDRYKGFIDYLISKERKRLEDFRKFIDSFSESAPEITVEGEEQANTEAKGDTEETS